MPIRILDRCAFRTTTVGTGSITIGSVVPKYRLPAAAGAVDGDQIRFWIEQGSDWEQSVCTVSGGGTTLARALVESSTGSLLSLSGDALVYSNDSAEDFLDLSTLANVALSGAYADLSGRPSLFSGAYADLSGKPALFSGAYADLSGKPTLFSGAYADLSGKPSLAGVALSGSYDDLLDTPALFSGSYNDLSDRPALFSGAYADLTGKPTLFSGAYADLSGKPTFGAVAFSNSYNDLDDLPDLGDGGSSYTNLFQPSANVLEQRNGASPQDWGVYANYTDATHYSRVGIRFDSTENRFSFGTQYGPDGGSWYPMDVNLYYFGKLLFGNESLAIMYDGFNMQHTVYAGTFIFKHYSTSRTIILDVENQILSLDNYLGKTPGGTTKLSGFPGTAGQPGGNLIVQGGDSGVGVNFAGGNAGNLSIRCGKQTDSSGGNEGVRGYITFGTYTAGATPTLTERQRITDDGLVRSFVPTSSGDPTTSDIPDGFAADWYNSTTGEDARWVSRGGTLKKIVYL